MDDVLVRIDAALLVASRAITWYSMRDGIAAARELIGSHLAGARVPPGDYPAQRWVLTQGRDDIASTTDASEAYELMARCRGMADAVLYLEIMTPLRVPMEQGRAKQDPISSFPAADANLPSAAPRADTTASEGGADGA